MIYLFAVHVIVATPGRILDLMRKHLADMSKCQMMVMDEVSIKHFEIKSNTNSFIY